jgi:preprotein translocase subunit SecF
MKTLTTTLAALCTLVLTALFIITGPEIVQFVMVILGIVLSFFLMAAAVLWANSRRKP